MNSNAKRIAKECQSIGKQLGNHQSDRVELPARDIGHIVTTVLSAGNLLESLDQFDPAGPVPAGWERKMEFQPDGKLVVSFTQTEPGPSVPLPPMPEGYGHPEPK